MDKLNKDQIRNLLPHRELMLVDEIYNIKKLHSATALIKVRNDSFFVQGHFWKSSNAWCIDCWSFGQLPPH